MRSLFAAACSLWLLAGWSLVGCGQSPADTSAPASIDTPGSPADGDTIAAQNAPTLPATTPQLPPIPEHALARHIDTLASDAFEGRAPATPGGAMTRDYLIDQMKAIGLAPGNGDSYEQPVGLVQQILIPSESALTLSIPGQDDWTLQYGPQTVFWSKQQREAIDYADSELVFVGFGIVAPEYGWNDYEGVDVTGKTVVILVNDPGFYLQGEAFNGRSMTYYGRWTYKYEEAARQGAAGAIIVHQTAPAAYGWGVVEGSWSGPQIDLERPDNGASRTMMEGWISEAAALDVFTMIGRDYEVEKQNALSPNFTPFAMGGVTASATLRNAISRKQSANLAGVLPGVTAPDEYVLYMAHWDHLGRSFASADDTINNGAVDNATGTAAILAIAESMANAPTPPDRSVMFVAVTAEESGLLGSAYFGADPLVPLTNVVGGINIDAMLPMGMTKDIIVIGYGASQLEDMLLAAAEPFGKYLRPDAYPERGYFYRSDHISLAKLGVPMLYADSGIDLVEGGEAAGTALVDDYTALRYHKPADEYDPADWPLDGMAQDVTIFRDVGAALAYSDVWPNWYDGNEFRALRDAQRAAHAHTHAHADGG